MKITRVEIEAGRLVNLVAEISAPALTASDCRRLPLVEILPGGRIEIVDGYHRIAGMLAAGETVIPCLTCDDDGLMVAAGNPEDSAAQAAALRTIYS